MPGLAAQKEIKVHNDMQLPYINHPTPQHRPVYFDRLISETGEVYEVHRALNGGRGGNGIVFKAERVGPEGTREACAVKMLNNFEGQRLARFRNEVVVMKRLIGRSCIARYFGSGELVERGQTFPWLAMELGGDNLRDYITRNGPLDRKQFESFAIQACTALEQVHIAGLVHRDIKHQNYVWSRDGCPNSLLIDFGLAKAIDESFGLELESLLTRETEFVGPRVAFTSPELIAYSADKKIVVGPQSDIWQLGRVLWFAATAELLASSPDEEDCPYGGALCKLVARMTAQKVAKRPGSISEVVNALREEVFCTSG